MFLSVRSSTERVGPERESSTCNRPSVASKSDVCESVSGANGRAPGHRERWFHGAPANDLTRGHYYSKSQTNARPHSIVSSLHTVSPDEKESIDLTAQRTHVEPRSKDGSARQPVDGALRRTKTPSIWSASCSAHVTQYCTMRSKKERERFGAFELGNRHAHLDYSRNSRQNGRKRPASQP